MLIPEVESTKPDIAPFRLSAKERHCLIGRAFEGLYRWYSTMSQEKRNWNPDFFVNWKQVRTDHHPVVTDILEGFYAVEQFAPDYTSELVRLCRKHYGRSQFQMRWGTEEEKHSDLWRNALLYSRARTPLWLEGYTEDLRANAWTPPWDDPLRMILYTVLQEKATQINYLNFGRLVKGASDSDEFALSKDVILQRAATVIAVDEAAHFDFFLEGALLYLYYFPEETLQALRDVLRGFEMPATGLNPNTACFVNALEKAQIFTPMTYMRSVATPALKALGIEDLRKFNISIARLRQVPRPDGSGRPTCMLDGVNFGVVETAVRNLFQRIRAYDDKSGRSEIDPCSFQAHYWDDVVEYAGFRDGNSALAG